MRVLVIGGSGQTGSLVIDEAIRRGHTVTALVRDSTSIHSKKDLTIVKGSPLNESDVEAAFTAASPETPNAVIVTLGSNRTSGNPWAPVAAPARLMADSHLNLVRVMKKHQIRKIATMAAFGTADSFPNLNFVMRCVISSSNLSFAFADHNLVDQEMKTSGLDYVIARPTRLTGGEAKPLKFYGNEGVGIGAVQGISRASVALFLVDAVERSEWDGSTPVIAN